MSEAKSTLEIRERGGARNGQPQFLDRRLFVQLRVFTDCREPQLLSAALAAARTPAVLYADVNDALGIGLLTWREDPGFFIGPWRDLLAQPPFGLLRPKPEYTMLGRTYALGHEPDLEDWLLEKPRRAVCNPQWPWAVWYPLRRKGAFAALPAEEAAPILSEHGRIGHQFGEAGYAQDVRLACFGLDANDNDFVIGLVGERLHPLSACVQAMRRTRQTAQFIERMGPFFVGKALWQASL